MSLVFDRAVDYYDQTRALDPAILNAALDALRRETRLTLGSSVLEVGAGTGRFALPLAERFGHAFGIDLSLPMMEVLRRKPGWERVRLAQADAVSLPFRAAAFDLIFGVHVLHLVSGWERAVGEAMRVLKPRGHFAVSFHRRVPASPNAMLRRLMRVYALEYGIDTSRPGAPSEEAIFEELSKWDPAARIIEVQSWQEADTPRAILGELDRQIFSETWLIPREVMDKVMLRLREWAAAYYGSLDAPIESPYDFRWLIVQKRE